MNYIGIIENTGIMRIRVERLLQEMGIESVEIPRSKYTNSNRFAHAFEGVDMLLVDIDNKEVDIIKVIRELKNDATTMHIPIIVLGSLTDIKILKAVIAIGCSDFILKPFDNQTFIKKIIKWLPNLEGHEKATHLDLVDEDEQKIGEVKLIWSDEFKIGVEAIDDEHKGIVDNFHRLYTLMREGKGHEYYEELVSFLEFYVNDHFAHEEAFQKSIGYDQLGQHRIEHENFKKQVRDIIEAHKEQAVTNMDLIKISIFIKDWLIHHVLMTDGRIGQFILAKK